MFALGLASTVQYPDKADLMVLHAAIDYYSLPAETVPCSRFKGPSASGNQGLRAIRCLTHENRKLEIKEYRHYRQRPSNSHLIPMRWEKHLLTNQIAISQLLGKARLQTRVISSTELGRSPSYQHIPKAQNPGEQLVKQCGVVMAHQQDTTLLTEELWDELSKLRSRSFGAVGLVAGGHGHKYWHLAFGELMEELLEDSEDILLTLPYTEIREALTHSREIFDHVDEGGLVLRSLDKSGELFVTEARDGFGTIDLQIFSDAIWADPEFDSSKRSTIMNKGKQML